MSKQAMTFEEWWEQVVELGYVGAEDAARLTWKAAQEAIKQHDAEPVAHVIGGKLLSHKNNVIPDGPLYLSAPSIPEGFVLVPKEPTERMLFMITPASAKLSEWRENYKSMLAAAPKPPTT